MRAASDLADPANVHYPTFVSPKIDGIGVVILDGVAYSRKLEPIPNEYVQRMVKRLNLPHGFHGEMTVAKNNDERTWNRTQSGIMSRDGRPAFIFNVFDWFQPGHLKMPFVDRYSALCAWGKKNKHKDRVNIVGQRMAHCAADVRAAYIEFTAAGYEGLMIRDPNGPYKQGRSTLREGYLLKMKPEQSVEMTVTGFEEQMHNANEATTARDGRIKRSKHKENMKPKGTLGALLGTAVIKGKKVKVRVGSGLSDKFKQEIWDNQKRWLGRTFTITFNDVTVNGLPRNPRVKGERND